MLYYFIISCDRGIFSSMWSALALCPFPSSWFHNMWLFYSLSSFNWYHNMMSQHVDIINTSRLATLFSSFDLCLKVLLVLKLNQTCKVYLQNTANSSRFVWLNSILFQIDKNCQTCFKSTTPMYSPNECLNLHVEFRSLQRERERKKRI